MCHLCNDCHGLECGILKENKKVLLEQLWRGNLTLGLIAYPCFSPLFQKILLILFSSSPLFPLQILLSSLSSFCTFHIKW